ncbi:MerR family DNA-binding transcriptional regulator [Enterococcus casseliflavus]
MTQECEKTPDKLYRIGMFSKMNQVTIKTLRYYDEVGLLKPHFIDPDNGYRYYISSQLAPLHRLLALRRMGYNID